MKQTLIYILSFLILYTSYSCAQEDPIEPIENNTITFVAEQTPYEGDGLPTKADDSYESIKSLYLLLFNTSGELIISEDMQSETEYAYVLGEDQKFANMNAYFLANFSSTYVDTITSESALSALDDLSYSTTTGPVKPTSDNIVGVPMVGKLEIIETDLGKIKTIELTRLFAKVDIEIKCNSGEFDLESYTLTNIPNKVGLSNTVSLNEGDFNSTIEFTLNTPTPITLPTLYVPEAKNGSYPLYLTLKGIYKRDATWSARVEYKIYLGGNDNASSSLERNTYYANVITINGVNQATTDSRVTYYGHNLADPTNSGVEEAANCYIISEPGRYMIPAVKGAGLSSRLDDASATNFSVISDGNNNNNITNIKTVTIGEKTYISFDITSVKDGNSVLIGDDWSWHLWFCKTVPGTHTYPNGSSITAPVLMDRNLGAGQDTQIGIEEIGTIDFHPVAGLYYRWGDKNPFISSDYTGVGSSGSWTNEKSNTDPCPPGYKIPSSGVWTNGIPADEITRYFVDGSFLYSEDFSKTTFIRYPFASYRGDNKGIVTFAPKSDGPHNTNPIADNSGSFQYSFTLNYKGTYQYKVARFASIDKAINCEYNHYTVDPNSLLYSGSFKITIPIINRTVSKEVKNYTQTQLKNYTLLTLFGKTYTLGSVANTLGISIDSICQELFSSIKNNNAASMNLSKMEYGTGDSKVSKSHGLQVRCVVDKSSPYWPVDKQWN